MPELTYEELRAAAREAENAYHREWRAKNKDKVRATNARYWEKRGRELLRAKKTEGK